VFGGRFDLWFGVLNQSLSALSYGRYLGGSGDELQSRASHVPAGLDADAQGCAYVVTTTASADFPVTAGAFDPTFSGAEDGTLTKIDPSKSGAASLVFSTFVGGSQPDGLLDVAVDPLGRAHVTGYTKSADYPLAFAVQPNRSSAVFSDAVVTVFDAAGTRVVFSTTLGRFAGDVGEGIGLASDGSARVSGTTGADFPTTAGSAQPTAGGGADAFVVRLELEWARRETYGTGHPGTLGVPSISASADPVVGATVSVDLGNSLGAATVGALFVGVQRVALPTPFGGTLLVQPLFGVTVAVPAFGLSVPITVPNDPAAIGGEVDFQAVEGDPGASLGVSFSRGLALVIGIG
jgi:hypothetical protein